MGFFQNFANENRKLWGFHLQKPHNPKFRKKNYGVFPNENPIIFDFHLQKKKNFENFFGGDQKSGVFEKGI